MSDYAYTYDLGQDMPQVGQFPEPVRELARIINAQAREGGYDRADLLRQADAPADVKAELADFWGGPGAGDEFRR